MRRDLSSVAVTFNIPLKVQFHVLPSDVVERIIQAADLVRYRAPKNANGSRARYFHARLVRDAARSANR